MIVHGDNKPATFSIENQPKHPGYCLIRFYENAAPYESEESSGWEYNEYHLEMKDREDLMEYVQNHYNELLHEAKGGPSEMERLRADLDYIAMMSGVEIPQEGGALNGNL